MKTKTKSYTWNEDLQRVISGDMPQEIEAYQHDKKERQPYNFPVDDNSDFLPRGYRRSEKWIAAREARERKERKDRNARFENERAETIERQKTYSDLNEFGSNSDFDIPHNQNRAAASEIREDYIWKIPLGIVVFFLAGVYILTHL